MDIQKNNINFKIQTKIKKVFFSAVTLVAFSFAGMANEIEEIEISKSKIETETNCIHMLCHPPLLNHSIMVM